MDYLVNTPCGTVRGTKANVPGVIAYKGIRYATAGRWEYPRQVKSWEGIYDATEYGACCYQPRTFFTPEEQEKRSFYHREFREGQTFVYSEDCLFLNIFTPEEKRETLPVLVYIHGGSFTGCCAHEKHYDCPVWPREGVIAVTIQYRLGPLGFACLPELKEEAGYTGNYGLLDQLTALQWIRDNIAAFGGDPENVTLLGQSAGAMSVQQLAFSPMSRGLFHKAVMMSGGGVHRLLSPAPAEKHYAFWKAAMKNAGCNTLEEFRAISPEALFAVWKQTQKEVPSGFYAPCIDGRFVTDTGVKLLKQGAQHQIPYMAGSTQEDMLPLILQDMARNWCSAQKVPSYTWLFDRRLPGDDKGAWHSADMWYWFGTLFRSWRPWRKKDHALSRQMVSYLCNFAKTGDPNGPGLPLWEPSSQSQTKVLRLGEKKTHMCPVSRLGLLLKTIQDPGMGV